VQLSVSVPVLARELQLLLAPRNWRQGQQPNFFWRRSKLIPLQPLVQALVISQPASPRLGALQLLLERREPLPAQQ
jgi:hypothetical protein